MYLGERVSRAINQEQKKHTALNEQNKHKVVPEQFSDRQLGIKKLYTKTVKE